MSESVGGRRRRRQGSFPLFIVLVVFFDMLGFILRDTIVSPASELAFPVTIAILALTTILAYWLVYRGGFDLLNPMT